MKRDAFEIFGSRAGTSPTPAGIKVVGGWETDGGVTQREHGDGERRGGAKGSDRLTSPAAAGCPLTGQPVLGDPLASKRSTTPRSDGA